MSRRAKPEKRPVMADTRYNSVTVQLFVHHMLRRGKKSTSQRLVYDCMDMIKEKTGRDPVEMVDLAVRNVAPVMEVRPRRVGGATYQVPMEVPADRRMALALRWILDAARGRGGKSFSEKLAGEILDACNNAGSAIRKRDETHKMAEANRAFSHYRM